MMHHNRFIAVVQTVEGATLREFPLGERSFEVRLPFGCEYRLYFKNLDSVKALVTVEVDGQDVLDGQKLVISPNSTSMLEGFLNGRKVAGKFKFIQKTEQIAEYRGDRLDDGIIRITVAFEKSYVRLHHHHHDVLFRNNGGNLKGGSVRGMTLDAPVTVFANNTSGIPTAPAQDEGITVPGSFSSQAFTYASIGETDVPFVLTFQLKGVDPAAVQVQSQLTKPVTTRTKVKCPTCGTKSSTGKTYCAECGTNIEVAMAR